MKPVLSLCLAACLAVLPALAAAEVEYPTRTVRLIVPANPGGGTDNGARAFAEFFEKHSTATVAIVNQPAGGGVVAAQTVARGTDDGSVLLFFHGALHTANLFGQSPFSWESFTPLATTSAVNEVFAVRANEAYTDMQTFIDYAKANPGTVNIGSQLGGTTQVKAEALNRAADGTMRVVDAGTEADRVTALLGKQVDVISMSVGTAVQYVEDDQMLILGVMNSEPDTLRPDLPTTTSQGVDVSLPMVHAVYGPENVDDSVKAAFDALMAEIVADPDYPDSLARFGHVPAVRNGLEAAEFLRGEQAMMADLIGK